MSVSVVVPARVSAFVRHPLSVAVALLLTTGAAQAQSQVAAPAPAASASAPDGVQVVTIRASADASAGGLKAPYAGGQVARGGRVGILGSQDIMETPFSVTNFTQKLVQDQQAQSIADVLQNDPAVRVARGFGNFQQLYMVRGLPIYSDDMSYNGLYGLLPRQYLAAELVERVEVLRGASAFLNGAAPGGSGLGGAVDVMPKRAPNQPLNEITVGTETGGQLYEALDVARRFGDDRNLGLRFTAVDRDGKTAVHGENRRLSVFSLGADYHTGDLRLSADIGSQDHKLIASTPSITIAGGLEIPAAPNGRDPIAQPWTFSNERDTFGTVRAEYDFTPALTGWAAAGLRDGHESAVFANPTVTAADGTATVDRFDNARHDVVSTGEVGLRGKFRTGDVGHTVIASAATYSLDSKNAYAFADFAGVGVGTIYDPTFVTPPDSSFFTGGKLTDPLTTQRTKTESLAIADVLSFWNDRVLLTLGARDQRIQQASYDYNTGVENAGAYKASRVTPVGGVVFKASQQVSVYATYVEGLVAGDIAPVNDGTHEVSNSGEVFKPYQTKQGELGVKVDFGRLGGAFSVFESRKPLASSTVQADGTALYGVADHQRNRGAEFTFFGEATPGVRLLGGASFLDTKLDGHSGIGAPKSQFNFDTEWDVPFLVGLTLDARAVHTSSQFADATNTQVVPAWSRFDLGARYAFDVGAKVVTLRVRVNNVANHAYWASAGGYPGSSYLTVGEPRSVVVSGTIDF